VPHPQRVLTKVDNLLQGRTVLLDDVAAELIPAMELLVAEHATIPIWEPVPVQVSGKSTLVWGVEAALGTNPGAWEMGGADVGPARSGVNRDRSRLTLNSRDQ
jgi:hypothetical protein